MRKERTNFNEEGIGGPPKRGNGVEPGRRLESRGGVEGREESVQKTTGISYFFPLVLEGNDERGGELSIF